MLNLKTNLKQMRAAAQELKVLHKRCKEFQLSPKQSLAIAEAADEGQQFNSNWDSDSI